MAYIQNIRKYYLITQINKGIVMQIKRLYIQILSFLVLVVLSEVSQANVATLSSNIANGSPFNTIDSGFTGQFDLNPYLAPSKDFNVPFQINSAHFDLTFSGANFFSQVTSTTQGWYLSCQRCLDNANLWLQDVYTSKFSPFENVAMYLNGALAAYGETKAFDTGFSLTGVTSNGYIADGAGACFGDINGQVGCTSGPAYLQTRTFTKSYGYDGTFTLSGDVTDFSSLSNTGLLSFNLAFGGGVQLLSSALTVNFSPNPVPEPESYAMFLAGLGFLGFMARRRNKLNLF